MERQSHKCQCRHHHYHYIYIYICVYVFVLQLWRHGVSDPELQGGRPDQALSGVLQRLREDGEPIRVTTSA